MITSVCSVINGENDDINRNMIDIQHIYNSNPLLSTTNKETDLLKCRIAPHLKLLLKNDDHYKKYCRKI